MLEFRFLSAVDTCGYSCLILSYLAPNIGDSGMLDLRLIVGDISKEIGFRPLDPSVIMVSTCDDDLFFDIILAIRAFSSLLSFIALAI